MFLVAESLLRMTQVRPYLKVNKRYKQDGSLVYLLPESNDEYHKPIILSEDDNVLVNGKVVDVFNF